MIRDFTFSDLRNFLTIAHDLSIQLSRHSPSTNVGERYYRIIHLHESYINANDLTYWFEHRGNQGYLIKYDPN